MVMRKMIVIIATLLVSVTFVCNIWCNKVYADEAETPVTLTKEAETASDCKQEEETIPDTGDRKPESIEICALVLISSIGVIALVTTATSHKNT